MAQIEIIFNTDGTTTVETKGIKGKSCKEASEFIEKALGEKTGERLTGEFYQSEENNINKLRR